MNLELILLFVVLCLPAALVAGLVYKLIWPMLLGIVSLVNGLRKAQASIKAAAKWSRMIQLASHGTTGCR